MVEIGVSALGVVIFATIIFGLLYRSRRGRIHPRKGVGEKMDQVAVDLAPLDLSLGTIGTFIQFSSAFCTPCRATRALLEDVARSHTGFVHHDIDAEKYLDLVRRQRILSTPTTLILNGQGVEIGRASGAPRRSEILQVVASLEG